MNSEVCFIPLSLGAKLEFKDMAIGLLLFKTSIDILYRPIQALR